MQSISFLLPDIFFLDERYQTFQIVQYGINLEVLLYCMITQSIRLL